MWVNFILLDITVNINGSLKFCFNLFIYVQVKILLLIRQLFKRQFDVEYSEVEIKCSTYELNLMF